MGRVRLRHGEHSCATRTASLNAVWIQMNGDSKQDVDYGCRGHPWIFAIEAEPKKQPTKNTWNHAGTQSASGGSDAMDR